MFNRYYARLHGCSPPSSLEHPGPQGGAALHMEREFDMGGSLLPVFLLWMLTNLVEKIIKYNKIYTVKQDAVPS